MSTRRRDDSLTFTVMSLGRRRARPQLLAQVARTGPGARLADAAAAMQRRRRDLYREYVGDRAVSNFFIVNCDAIHQ